MIFYIGLKTSLMRFTLRKKVYAVILESSENKDFFEKCHTYSCLILEISLIASVRWQLLERSEDN